MTGAVSELIRGGSSPASLRLARWLLAGSALVYLTLALYLTRDVTFTVDELIWFAQADGFAPSSLFEPYNNHLIAITRLEYVLSLELFGTTHLPIRLVLFGAVVATSAGVFAFAASRVPPGAALAAALVPLTLGAAPQLIDPSVAAFPLALAPGVWALVAFERGGRAGGAVAAALLTVAVLAIEIGVLIAAGVAVWILVARQPWKRLWIPALPLVAYATWWVAAPRSGPGSTSGLADLPDLPTYVLDSLAGAFSALAGPLATERGSTVFEVGATRPLAVIGVFVVATLLIRRRPALAPPALAVAVMLALFWFAGWLAENPLRPPEATRYSYAVVVLAVLLGTELARRADGRRLVAGSLAAVAVVGSLGLVAMRQQGNYLSDLSALTRATLTAYEANASEADPERSFFLQMVPVEVGDYLEAAERHGSLAYQPGELADAPIAAQRRAEFVDRALSR